MGATTRVAAGTPAGEPIVLDLTDPPGGRSWLAVADAVHRLVRTPGVLRAPLVVVGAPAVRPSREMVTAAGVLTHHPVWAASTVEPWQVEPLLEPLLAAATDAVRATDAARATEGARVAAAAGRPAPDHVDEPWTQAQRAATTAVVATAAALGVRAPLLVEEVLLAGGAGPWMRWARRHVGGRPTGPRPRSGAIAAGSTSRLADPAAVALELARAELDVRSRLADADLTRPAGVARAANAAAPPAVPVVLPPRPHRNAQVVRRTLQAQWDGAVVWGNTWTRELTWQLHDHLKLSDEYQVLTTVSGTAALRMAYEVIAPAATPGDVAAVPAFTFPATVESLRQLGYRLRFVDVDPLTWTMDPARLAEALQATPRARLVVVVDSLGAPAAHEAIAAVARAAGVPVVADSAPALGARYHGKPVGTQQQAHAFSLSFAKTVTAGGAGGVLVLPAGVDVERGRNWWRSSSMRELNAVFALDQLAVVEDMVARRQTVADVYDEVLAAYGLTRQQAAAGDRHAWVHYTVRFDSPATATRVGDSLLTLGVQTKPYYAPVLSDPVWADLVDVVDDSGSAANLPVTTALAGATLALPMSSELQDRDVEQVAAALWHVLRRQL